MKGLQFFISVFVIFISLQSFTIPIISLWKHKACGPVFNVVVPIGGGLCESHTEQLWCHSHPFRTNYQTSEVGPTTVGACGGNVHQGGTNYPPYIATDEYYLENMLLLEIAQLANELEEIHNTIIEVPEDFKDEIAMINDPALYLDALEFRYSLCGYAIDLTEPDVLTGCSPLVISLPVIIPQNYNPPFNKECIYISPNPASHIVNVNFNGHDSNVDEINLVNVNSGISVYQKNGVMLPVEQIDVTTFTTGMYSLIVTNGVEKHTYNILIE